MSDDDADAIPALDHATRIAQEKAALRRQVRARRERVGTAGQADRDRARLQALRRWLESLRPQAVAAYLSTGLEPTVTPVVEVLHARGIRVLLPVLGHLPDGSPRRQPDWAWYEGPGTLIPGIWGIPDPCGTPLGIGALAAVDAILLPGLAVDGDGYRLGVGGGWYDRALPHARPEAPRCIVLNDDEVVAGLPHGDHDQRVSHVVTPTGLREVGSLAEP